MSETPPEQQTGFTPAVSAADLLPAPDVESPPFPPPPESAATPEAPVPRGVEAMDPDEVRAQRERVERLRRSPAVQAVMAMAREVPELTNSVMNIVDRREELQTAASRPGERHRVLTALFAGMMTTPRLAAMMDDAIDREIAAQTEFYQARIAAGHTYAPLLTIGTGPNGQIYNAEMQVLTDVPTMTVDSSDRLGGDNFGALQGSYGELNSRNRPEDRDAPHRPGRPNSLNSLGRGVLQESDVDPDSYGDQHKFIRAVRANEFMVSEHMLGTQVTGIRVNRDPGRTGEVLSFVKNGESGAVASLSHEAVVLAGGIGKFEAPIRNDKGEVPRRTERILNREAKKPLQEKRIFTAQEYAAYISDPRNAMPLQGWENVAVWGSSDSGRQAVLRTLGYEGNNRQSVPNLDYVKQLDWYFQQSDTKEEYSAAQRLRYILAGLEFPREEDPDYVHRINPIDEKATRLEEAIDADGNKNGNYLVATRNDQGEEELREYDHIIICAGYKDRTAEVLGMLQAESVTDPDEIRNSIAYAVAKGGRLITTSGTEIEILATDDPNDVDIRVLLRQGAAQGVSSKTNLDELKVLIAGELEEGGIASLELPALSLETEFVYANGRTSPGPEVIADDDEKIRRRDELLKPGVSITGALGDYIVRAVDGDQVTTLFTSRDTGEELETTYAAESYLRLVAIQGPVQLRLPPDKVDLLETEPIALKYKGVPVYRIGPSAQIPISAKEVEVIPVLGKLGLGENVDAVFRYAERDEAFAEWLADQINPMGINSEDSLVGERPTAPVQKFQQPVAVLPDPVNIPFGMNAEIEAGSLPSDGNYNDYITYAAAVYCQTHVFPAEVTDFSFTTTRGGDGAYSLEPDDPILSQDGNYRMALRELVSDPLMQAVIAQMSRREHSRVGKVHVSLPMNSGRVDLAAAGAAPVRR